MKFWAIFILFLVLGGIGAFFAAKLLVWWTLSITVHTAFGVKWVTYGTYSLCYIFAVVWSARMADWVVGKK